MTKHSGVAAEAVGHRPRCSDTSAVETQANGADVVNVRLQTSSRSTRRQPPAQQVRQLGDVTGEARGHPYAPCEEDAGPAPPRNRHPRRVPNRWRGGLWHLVVQRPRPSLGSPPAPPGIAMVCARRPLWSVGHAPGADRQAHVGAMVHEMAIAGRTDRRVRSPGEPMPREPQPLRPSSSLVLIACPPAPAGSHACGEFSVLPLMKIKWSSAVCRSAR
jgi:hypothetical protein